jgi:protein-tyrosine phosphatase
MLDMHSHILFGVDDGASSISESIEMLSSAKKAGVNDIIATPHFDIELYNNGTGENHFIQLQNEAEKQGITLLKGYEIKIRNYPAQMPDDYEGLTLHNTRYILFELPFDRVPDYTSNLLYELQLKKFIPILAHPERCLKLLSNKILFMDIVESGCLIQVDAASIIGINGRKAKRFSHNIVKEGFVNLVASDAHSPEGYLHWLKAFRKVKRWVGCQKAEQLFSNGYKLIIENAAVL